VAAFTAALAHAINQSGGLADDDVPPSEFAPAAAAAAPVSPSLLRLAVPKDKANPYANEWLEVNDPDLAAVAFADYAIVAFAHLDEPFAVVEAAYEEE
jgi:hypothetical protein